MYVYINYLIPIIQASLSLDLYIMSNDITIVIYVLKMLCKIQNLIPGLKQCRKNDYSTPARKNIVTHIVIFSKRSQ
jgi:hypothetical protein